MLSRSFRYQAGTAVALALLANTSAWAKTTPTVDTRSTSTSSNVTREQLENMPVGRRLEDLVRTCPGNTIPTVSRQPDVLIDGKPLVDINCIQPADIEMVEVYKVHNDLRAEYGAPPLVWDPLLIQGPKGAQSHANALAAAGTLFHSSRDGRGTVRENVGQGLAGASVGQMLGGWTKEKKNFIPGTFPNVSRTNNWYDIGHIAQMLWISTVMIGCAKAAGIGAWLVCRYDPGGNKDGQLVGIPPPRQYAVEQPKLPTTEVFTQGSAQNTTSSNDPGAGRRASLFDLGIYAGGAYTTDWFDVGQSDPVIASTNIDDIGRALGDILLGGNDPVSLNHDYGFDGALFVGYDLGAFQLEAEVAYKQADIDAYDTTIRLPGETAQQPVSDNEGPDLSVRYPFGPVTVGSYYVLEEEAPDGDYDVREAFAEVRIPLLRDTPFFEGLDRAGYVYDRFDFGSSFGMGNQFLAPDLHVPLTQNGSINLAYLWLQSDIATAGGGAASAASQWREIDWTPIEDLLFRGSWAEGYRTPVPTDSSAQPTLVDTTVVQPTLPTTEVFNPAPSQPAVVKPGTYEPSNENKCTAWRFFDAERMYRDAKARSDTGAMITAKAHMAEGIMNQYQAVEAAVEAGEMSKVPAYGLADFLGKMMENYKELTGELPPGYYEPPNGFELDEGIIKPVEGMQPPDLPATEVFNPADFKSSCDDVM